MFKSIDTDNNVYTNDWKESINGTDNEFVFRFNKRAVLAAAGEDDVSDVPEDEFYEINVDQVKMLQYQNSANNNYQNVVTQRTIVGGSLGNTTCNGRIVLRDGKSATIELIKKAIFDRYKAFKESVGLNGQGFGAESIEADVYGGGFFDLLEGAPKEASFYTEYGDSQLAEIDASQLPDFDIIAMSKTATGEIKAKLFVKGVKLFSTGMSDSVDSLEKNTIQQFKASEATGWIPVDWETE